MNPATRPPVSCSTPSRARGFTLIELMTTVAVLAIITSLAIPSLRTFLLRNKVSSLSNELTAAMSHARALAVSRNACVTLCVASSSNSTTCAGTTSAANFQTNGWVMFENPVCNAAQTVATADGGLVLQQRTGASDDYVVTGTAGGLNIVMFDPRGYANLAAAGTYQVQPPGSGDTQYRRKVCLDAAGRASVRADSQTC